MMPPDTVVAFDGRRELESRIGIEPLDTLLAERHDLVGQVADLRARFGGFGTYGDLRKIELARIAQLIRAQALNEKVKMTAAEVDDAAHSDPRYAELVITATKERATWSLLEDRISAIEHRIARDNALCAYARAELSLT